MVNKVKTSFPFAAVCKNKNSAALLTFLELPAEVKGWLLSKFSNEDGEVDAFGISEYVKEYRLKPDEWNIRLLEARHSKKGVVKLLTKVKIEFDYVNDFICFSLPEYNFPKKAKEAQVDWSVVSEHKEHLLTPNEVWGELTILCDSGIVTLMNFSPLCPYTYDLADYRNGRKQFSVEEWIDVLLGGLNFNPAGFSDEAKLTLLQRFLPNVEKRLNTIELSIKGSAKSYSYSSLSPHNWLTSGTISRATAFYDMTRKAPGYFSKYGQIIFDECQTITCQKPEEMNGLLKTYLENGEIRVGQYCGVADSGLTLVGNIPISEEFNIKSTNMFKTLPKMFREAPLLDRFAGIIEGQKIGRFSIDKEMEGWALSSNYLAEIFFNLREEFFYRAIVDKLLIIEGKADKRNVEAIKKLCTAYLKLLFPHITSVKEVNIEEFRKYCLNPSIKMRTNVLYQLRLLDSEYSNVQIPTFKILGEE